jgi:hypothetical protein
MRMFLIGMTDIFLILYLTAIANPPSQSVLTVDDFYKLKSMHQTLSENTEKTKTELSEKLKVEKLEREVLVSKLIEEQAYLEEIEESLFISDVERKRINKELDVKENILKNREKLLADLNKKIENKEEVWEKMEASLTEELKTKEKSVEANRELVKKFQGEAERAQILANQMKEEVKIANKTAETANEVHKKALIIKDEALKEKVKAELKATTALVARNKAETEKHKAVKAMEVATLKAEELSGTIKDITQAGEDAYSLNIRPHLQTLTVSYSREVSDTTMRYERELNLLPVTIDNKTYIIFPSRHIGFNRRADRAPDNLRVSYANETITNGLINKEDDLIAIELPNYTKDTFIPYPLKTDITQMMPTLLALRNNGNRSLSDKLRGLSEEYFIVNRDFIETDTSNKIRYGVSGFRGTGIHGEKIIPGDQLVDLTGRFIGVAHDDNDIIRIDSLSGWHYTALTK